MKRLILLFAFACLGVVLTMPDSLLSSTIWEINQDGTGNFSSIQEGIDAAANSDTVLVYPGIYYENLEIIEKAITLGSLYLTTGEEIYISYTILDGDQTSSVIRIVDSSLYYTMSVVGFVIQNGIGYLHTSDDRYGGGLSVWDSNLALSKCFIQHNNANNSGGGIALVDSNLELSGTIIRFNESNEAAGGLIIGGQSSSVSFSAEELNSIYMNYSGKGNDIYISSSSAFQEIIVDTFTVVNPDDDYYLIFPGSGGAGTPLPDQFSIDIQHGYVDQVDQDLYVAPDGNNNNSGITLNEPLQTIAYALVKVNSDSLVQRTVHIKDGTYSVSQNNQIWPLQIKSKINIVGESRENTILDAENLEGFFIGESGQKNYCIENLSLLHHRDLNDFNLNRNRNVYINNIRMANSYLANTIFIHHNDITFNNIIIENSEPGGLYYYSPNFSTEFNIFNSKISGNNGNVPIYIWWASGIVDSLIANIINTEVTNNIETCLDWLPRTSAVLASWDTKLNLVNSTIGDNTSLANGAAVQVEQYSEASIVNSIVYGNEPYNLCLNGSHGPNTLNANNSLIEGGIDGILNMGTNYINWDDETMLDEDPLWLGFGYMWPYALSANSPCIDTGTLELPFGVELPAYDLAGNPRVMGSNIDMGAYEFPGNAAPIYLEINNEILSWQMPSGFSPTGYNIYLDDDFQSTLNPFLNEFTFDNLIIGDTYKAGVSALYGTEETAIIPKYFTYQPVGIEETTHHLPLTSLLSNFPNPFNPSTKISYNISVSGKVELIIYNIKGQKVKQLINATLSTGSYSVTWNGKDTSNKPVATGEYLAKLKVNGVEVAVNKMLLLK